MQLQYTCMQREGDLRFEIVRTRENAGADILAFLQLLHKVICAQALQSPLSQVLDKLGRKSLKLSSRYLEMYEDAGPVKMVSALEGTQSAWDEVRGICSYWQDKHTYINLTVGYSSLQKALPFTKESREKPPRQTAGYYGWW